jgi:hypothetical protein
MKYQEHLKRFRKKINFLIKENEQIKKSDLEYRDYSLFFTECHWAVFHLISALLDFIDVLDKFKHLNHRNIKKALLSNEVIKILGENAKEILEIYRDTLIYYSRGEYGYSNNISNEEFKNYLNRIKKLKRIVKEYLGDFNEND